MTTADQGRAAPSGGAYVTEAPEPSRSDAAHDAARSALAAARIGAPGGADDLVALLRAAAERYVGAVLCLPVDDTEGLVEAAVARAVRGLPRDLGPDELADHLHLAVRQEAFRRQPGAHGRATRRVLAAAALVLVVLAMGAVAVVVAGSLGDEPAPATIAAVEPAATREVEGRVVDTSAAGTVLGGRPEVEVALVADGETVRTTETDASGVFAVGGLAPGSYEVRLEVPVGHRLRGARDGRSTTVDLTERSEARLVLQLQRS